MFSKKERVAIVSVVASGSLAAAKFAIGVMIGSLALISDALHSTIDLGATLVTWFAVRVGDRPPDEEHHYGHGKVESVAALAMTALLFLLAGGVAVEAVGRLQAGVAPVPFSGIAFAVMGVEIVVNGWRAHVLRRTAAETGSPALEADSLHFASDMFGSVAVIAGLALAALGHGWGDPAAALAVAALVTWLGVRLGRRTVAALVDTAPAGVAERLASAIGRVSGVVGVERVRVRVVGPLHFVDAILKVPRTYSIDRIDALKSEVQAVVAQMLGEADVTVTTTPIALDDETVHERVTVIARNRALAIHHLTVHHVGERLVLAIDLEVDGHLTLAAAHAVADELEHAVREELGPEIEVETHIEPLQASHAAGRDASPERVTAVRDLLSELSAQFGTVRDIHDVRVRATEDGEIVNFHCRVDPSLTVQAVHEMVDEVEYALRRRMPQVKRVVGHAEPLR